MDFLFFVYGFSFLLLAAILWGRHRQSDRLPWDWLLAFALLHGGNEWLDMLALSLGDTPAFKAVRLFIMAASFVPLVEFGRAGLRLQGVHIPGRWIFAPLLGLAAAGVLVGMDGLNPSCRYALGMTGGLLAARRYSWKSGAAGAANGLPWRSPARRS